MPITTKSFGKTKGGQDVTLYTLKNHTGASVGIIDLGGTIVSIIVPDKNGVMADVNLGFDNVSDYEGDCGYMGALIGRFGNRIGGASFDLDGVTYPLVANDQSNNLHGGPEGFNLRIWDVNAYEEENACFLACTLESPDMDQGFPGHLKVKVVYGWNDQNELSIHYHATTDKATVINLTNHAYFNLDGFDAGDIKDLEMQIFADSVTETTPDLIPTGTFLPCGELVYGFQKMSKLGDVLAHCATDPVMKTAGGVDFNYCASTDKTDKCIALLRSPKTGRTMKVITDEPGVQCYTGHGLNHTGKNGVHFGAYAGMCLETQHYPDAMHHDHFPSVVLRPDEEYDTTTIYSFGVY